MKKEHLWFYLHRASKTNSSTVLELTACWFT